MDALNEAVIENMRFTLTAMGSLDSSRFLALDDDSFLMATGTDAASENWLFMSARPKKVTVEHALRFFGDLGLPFICPVLPGAQGAGDVLEETGLQKRGELTAMARALAPSGEMGFTADLVCEAATSRDEASLWAEVAWQAFDSPPDAPASFANLARGLCGRDDFIPVTARRKARPVGTYLLSISERGNGVYYFATLPEARRTGVGNAMMDDILRRTAEHANGPITLQATPPGLPFYTSRGFDALFKIPVHSLSPDIF
ncbi:MAG: GNAT family N-acetyltransferase [Synergistaceae bacterium]|jgi:GNAT superfamily N-acetyltransferase|nr:GNAT family N-acetyltransferase [Synergistaceae bacterium]